MKVLMSVICFMCAQSVIAKNEAKHSWQADGGELKVYFFYDLLNDFDIDVKDGLENRNVDWSKNEVSFSVRQAGGLSLYVPYDGLKAVNGGQLLLEGEFSWMTGQQKIKFKNLMIKPVTRTLKAGELTALEIVNDQGDVFFYLDHIHAGFNADKSWVEFNNMDLRMSEFLAQQLNKPFLNNFVVGHAHMSNHVVIPTGYEKDHGYLLGACSAGSNWPAPGNDADVTLIEMSAQYVRSIGADHAVFAPSATLMNEGQADVTWYPKFSGSFDPYNTDQHPYLNWSMYREIDGRFEQIGVSGIKHAFFTVNTVCSCAGGNVLFPGCADTYSVGNNDSGSNLGPRHEISTFDGIWQSTGSFFDQDSNGVQDNNSNGTDENRMVVAEADFSDPLLNYYISSWYIIRDDVNIFNSMGYRGYQITANGGGWIASSVSSFTQGPASDQYVAPDTFDLVNMTASKRILQAGEGHLTVAVKVIDLGGGQYRYNYMVENHDYDPQVKTISIPLNDLSSMSNFVFSDVDENSANDWTLTHTNNELLFTAPIGNEIEWGSLYSFSFTSDAEPDAGQVMLSGAENGGTQFSATVLAPNFDDLIFATGFEILN